MCACARAGAAASMVTRSPLLDQSFRVGGGVQDYQEGEVGLEFGVQGCAGGAVTEGAPGTLVWIPTAAVGMLSPATPPMDHSGDRVRSALS